jgi:hypothetical protein
VSAPTNKITSLAAPGFGFVFGALVLAFAFVIKDHSHTFFGPRFWPFLIAISLLVINGIELIRKLAGHEIDGATESMTSRSRKLTRNEWIAVLDLLIFPFMTQLFGFLFGSAFFLLIFMLALGYRRILPTLGSAILFSVVVTGFFTKIAYMPLPKGTGIFEELTLRVLQSLKFL